jgi:hypothetical protein
MKNDRTGLSLVAVAATSLALAATAGPATMASAAPATSTTGTTGWRVSTTVSVPSASTQMLSVTSAAPIPSWTWAVGGATPVSGTGNATPVAETWTGRAWSRLIVPAKAVSALGADPVLVTATAARDNALWAFTQSGGWLIKFGSNWTAGRLTTNPVVIDSSWADLAEGGAWAFGALETPGGFMPYATHAQGVGFPWKQVSVPGHGTIVSASAAPGGTLPWAILENDGFPKTSVTSSLIRWTQTKWLTVSLPARLHHAALAGILVRGSNSVWVGGSVKNTSNGTSEVIGHWNGHRWQVTTLPAPATAATYRITSMTTDGSGGIWALATCFASQCPNGAASRLWHEQDGHWSGPVVPRLGSKPTVLTGLYNMRHGVWAAGSVLLSRTRSQGLIALWGTPPA